jgi:DNA-binding CsgD family transcriptional regulator
MSIAEIKANCPDRANHQEGPKVVAEWEVWASTMWKSHIRTDCPSCGLTLRWKRRQPTGPFQGPKPLKVKALTDRQRQVLLLAAEGLTAREIGAKLFIHHGVVSEHLRKAREFFGARTLIQSVVLACHAGIIRREP